MFLEEGLMGLMSNGLKVVMGAAFAVILYMMIYSKKGFGAYIWILMHLGLFFSGIWISFKTFAIDQSHPMASEENSFILGFSGMLWFLSVICLIVAVYQFSQMKRLNK